MKGERKAGCGKNWSRDQSVNKHTLWWSHCILITNWTDTSGLALCLAVTQPSSFNTSAVLDCHSSSPCEPGCPMALLPAPVNSPPIACSFACMVSVRMEPLWSAQESIVSPALQQWPSTRKKPNQTRDSYLGQCNAEMREREYVRRGISVPHPGFCSLSEEIQALIYSNRRVMIIDPQPPHPTHCYWEIQPTAVIPTPTCFFKQELSPMGPWTDVCRACTVSSFGGWSTIPCLQHAPSLVETLLI